MWLSVFALRSTRTSDRRPGLYGVAFVDYLEGSPLTYSELLVARLARDGRSPRVSITDIWVDSAPSRDGGRSLWAIPKELADFHEQENRAGPGVRTSWSANVSGEPTAAARFTGVHLRSPRAPFRFSTWQHRDDGTAVVSPVSGSAATLPCLGRWDFGVSGPLAWLAGRRPVATFRLSSFRLTFGA